MKASFSCIPIAIVSPSSSSRPLRNRNNGFFYFLFLCCAAIISFAVATSAMSINANDKNSQTPDVALQSVAKSTIDFLSMARGLKTTPRTGWIRQKAGPRIESVADHSWRMSLMAMVAASSWNSSSSDQQTYDMNRCIKIALVHDLAEATVGDITPHCGVSDQTKYELELNAISSMTSQLVGGLPGSSSTKNAGNEILELWKEYEAGVTPEAKLVKDMDKLEMILQALEYETDGKNEESLDGFFDSTRGKWRTPIGKMWGEEIEKRRRKLTPPEHDKTRKSNQEDDSATT